MILISTRNKVIMRIGTEDIADCLYNQKYVQVVIW